MRGRRVRLTIGVVGTIAAVGAEWVALDNGGSPSVVLLDLAIGLAYLYGGLAIWDRAPANRTGLLMTSVGLTWFIKPLEGSQVPVIGLLADVLVDTSSVLLLALVLAYPTGRLETRIDRLGIAVFAVLATVANGLYLVQIPLIVNEGINGLYVGLGLAVMSTVLIVRRWVFAPARRRSDLLPVLLAGSVFIVTIAVNLVRRIALIPDEAAELLVAVTELAPAAIPVSLLVGFYRQSEHRLQALVDAIPDPLFRIGPDGRLLGTGTEAGGDGVQRGHRVGPLIDAMFTTRRDLALRATQRALDEGELQSLDVALDLPGGRRELEVRLAPSGPEEVTAIVRDFTEQRQAEAEVRRSRARIVEAADAERRRVERNLHDGAQQRLVALSLALRRAQAQLEDGSDAGAAATLEDATAQLRTALAELRELARGIHPAILTESGLEAALRSLASESPLDVTLALDLPDGLSSHVEVAAYFVVAEALTNVVKYAEAGRVEVLAGTEAQELRVEVSDDGRGGADPSAGSGLRGLSDRAAALGGRLDVRSPIGAGTRVVARFPLVPPDEAEA